MATSLGTFRALDHHFSIEIEGTSPVDIGDLFRALGSDELRSRDAEVEPTAFRFVYAGSDDSGDLFRDGRRIASGRSRVLLQRLISRRGQAVAATDLGGAVHATTLRVDGGTVLLAGPTASGKSTLSARLLIDGAALVAEDISVIDPETLDVRTYHRPLGLAEESFELLGIPMPRAAGEPCGCGGKVLTAAHHLGAGLAAPARPTVVALVDRNEDTLVRLSPAAALARILEAGVAPTPDAERDLDTLIRTLAGARCVAIGTADLAGAAGWITQLVAGDPSDGVPTLVERHDDRIDVYAGTEAVVVGRGQSHLLNASAAAVWLLRREGLDSEAICTELQAEPRIVDAALAGFADAGLT